MIKYLVKIHMNTTTFFRKRNVVLFVTSSILIVALLVSVIGRPTNMTGTTIGTLENLRILKDDVRLEIGSALTNLINCFYTT